jgi:hypothetical protein
MATRRTKYINDVGANSYVLVFTSDFPFNVQQTDRYVLLGSGEGGPVVNLPASPFPGEFHVIRDWANAAAGLNITVNGNGNNIDGSASFTINKSGAHAMFMWDSANSEWKTVNYSSNFVASQDIAGTNTSQTVVALTGALSSGHFRVTINAEYLQWANNAASANITIASIAGATIPLTITGQSSTSGVNDGGPVVINGGAPNGGGAAGYVSLQNNGTEAARAVSGQLNVTAIGIGGFTGSLPTITQGTGVPATTPANGSLFMRTDGSSGSNGLYTRQGGAWFAIGGGGGSFTAGGDLTGDGTAQYVTSISGSAGGGGNVLLNSITFIFSAGTATPSILQSSVAIGPGQDMTIRAQGATGVAQLGGRLILAGGTGTASHGNGDVVIRTGNIDMVTISDANVHVAFNLPIQFVQTPTNGAISISQANTSGAGGSAMTITAQGATDAHNGGALQLQGGLTTGALKGGVRLQLNASSTETLVEVAQVVSAQRVVSLAFGANLTSTQMPTNTGDLVVFLANAATNPTANPVGGGILYSTAGALHWRGSGGTDTPIAPA